MMSDQEWTPPDSGCRAWLVVVASVLICGILEGLENAYSVLYVALLKYNQEAGIRIEASYAGGFSLKFLISNVLESMNKMYLESALVFSMTTGLGYMMGPLGGILVDKAGFRVAGVVGCCMVAISLLASSWMLHSVPLLYLTFSFLTSIGIGIITVTTISVLGFYFRKRLGLVNGIVTSAMAFAGALYSPFVTFLLTFLELPMVFRVLAGIVLSTAVLSLIYKIPSGAPKTEETNSSCFKNVNMWKNKKYIIWCCSLPFALFGIWIPYVHIVNLGKMNFPNEPSFVLPLFLNISGIFRIVFGIITDNPSVNVTMLVQAMFFVAGLLTISLPLINNWILLQVDVFFLGIANGAFWSMLGVIATQLCGVSAAPQALGFMYVAIGIGCISGPPVAGYLFDETQSYFLPHLLGGLSTILGGVLTTAMHFIPSPHIPSDTGGFKRMN